MVDPLVQLYRSAWERIVAEELAIMSDPARFRRQARLREMRERIFATLDQLDATTRQWIATEFPRVYALGAAQGATDAGGAFTSWTLVHEEAVNVLANDLFKDLLQATRYVRRDTKRFIREAAKVAVQRTVTGEQTAVGAAREMATRFVRERGITAVIYRDGSRHGLGEYSEMAVRTKSAIAYNEGTLNGAGEFGVKYWEVFDGPECGWTFHDDTEQALGRIVTEHEARSYPISHPNCRRSFGARPDLSTREGRGQVTAGQTQAQMLQDALRRSQQRRRATRRRSRTTRRTRT